MQMSCNDRFGHWEASACTHIPKAASKGSRLLGSPCVAPLESSCLQVRSSSQRGKAPPLCTRLQAPLTSQIIGRIQTIFSGKHVQPIATPSFAYTMGPVRPTSVTLAFADNTKLSSFGPPVICQVSKMIHSIFCGKRGQLRFRPLTVTPSA